jgi:hypothetical protein
MGSKRTKKNRRKGRQQPLVVLDEPPLVNDRCIVSESKEKGRTLCTKEVGV